MSDELKRTQTARDESERLLREVYRVLCGSPAFQRDHTNLDNAVRAHLEARARYHREQLRRK